MLYRKCVQVGENESGKRHKTQLTRAIEDNDLEIALMPVPLNQTTTEVDVRRFLDIQSY